MLRRSRVRNSATRRGAEPSRAIRDSLLGFARCIEDRGLAHDGAAAQQFSPPAHVTLAAPIQVPTAVTEPLTQVHESVAGANCHRSLSVPNAPVESMP
jgi:hypothetical protein